MKKEMECGCDPEEDITVKKNWWFEGGWHCSLICKCGDNVGSLYLPDKDR